MTTLSKQRRDTPEVYFPTKKYFSINKQFTDDLIRSAESAPRQRIRMCVHSEDDAVVHQMFIVHPGGAYIRPHKHNKKDESLLVLEGSVDYLLFSEAGQLEDRVELSDFQSGSSFFQITPAGFYHSLIIKTRWLVFVEVTNGPFVRGESTFAPWSPEEEDVQNVTEFLNRYTLIK